MSKSSSSNPHKTLTRLITANIVLDLMAIAIWAALPADTWYVSARFFNSWLRSSLGRHVFYSNPLWTEKKANMGAHSCNHNNRKSTRLRSLRILSKYSYTNTSDLEFGNNLLCFKRYKNFKKYR
jgi:hypothetical protein